MEVLRADIYDYPRYYDLVYGSDWHAEFRFLLGCFDRHARAPVRRVFEPACGTGRLLFRLGREGYEVSGLDLNPKAVQYCNDRLVRHGLPASVLVGDMTRFHLPRKVDAAFNMINSFRHLPDESSAQRHLQAMARALPRVAPTCSDCTSRRPAVARWMRNPGPLAEDILVSLPGCGPNAGT